MRRNHLALIAQIACAAPAIHDIGNLGAISPRIKATHDLAGTPLNGCTRRLRGADQRGQNR